MANDSVKLNTLYESKLLLPWYEPTSEDRIKHGRPLYAISAKAAADDDNGELAEFEGNAPGWENESVNTYSSPTNVRRLFLGVNKVFIHTYKPIIKNGKSMDKLAYTKGLGNDFENAIKSIIDYQTGGDIAYSHGMTEITGQPLKYIYKPWIMSNIEEIYIEAGLLFEANTRNKIGTNNVIKLYQSNNISTLKERINIIFRLLMGDKAFKEGLAKMPRLKYFGIVDSIDGLDSTKYSNVKNDAGIIISTLETFAKETGKPENTYCIYDRKPGVGIEDNNEFKVRSYYKFDTMYLAEFARALFRETGNNQTEKAKIAEAAAIQKEQASKTEFELLLDKCFEEDNVKAQIAFNSIMMSNNREAKEAIYKSFTNSGKTKYQKLFAQFNI